MSETISRDSAMAPSSWVGSSEPSLPLKYPICMSGSTTQFFSDAFDLVAELLGSLIAGPGWMTGHSGPVSHAGEIWIPTKS